MRDGRNRLPVEFDRLLAPSSAYAPRKVVSYLCDREHLVAVPFAVDAEVPETWECRCGQPAALVSGVEPPAEPAAPAP
jgi:RNA polymerase-binding protein